MLLLEQIWYFKIMTNEQFEELKTGYIDFVTNLMVESGGLDPSITVLGKHIEDDKNAIVHVPIPSKYMKDDEAKDEFIEEVLPNVAKKLKEVFDIEVVVWASEAWLRVVDTKDKEATDLKDWKSIPIKKEVVIVTFDSASIKKNCIMEVVRKGKQVNEEGELSDSIELRDMPDFKEEEMPIEIEGRFAGLYKKFTSI